MTADEARAKALYEEACAVLPGFDAFLREAYSIGRIPRDFVGPIHPDTIKKMDPPMIAGLRNIQGITYR